MPEIGVVGLGRMGLLICANLVRGGYTVLAGDRLPEAARQAAGRTGNCWPSRCSKSKPTCGCGTRRKRTEPHDPGR